MTNPLGEPQSASITFFSALWFNPHAGLRYQVFWLIRA